MQRALQPTGFRTICAWLGAVVVAAAPGCNGTRASVVERRLLPQGHVKYGLARLNAEVAAWMRGDAKLDGSHAEPPFVAMGCAHYAVGLRS